MTAAVVRPASRHWSGALLGAVLLHAGLAMVFHQMLDTGAGGAGRTGIEIGLGPAGGSPGQAAGEVAPQEAGEKAVEAEAVPAETAVPLPEAIEPIDPVQTAAMAPPSTVKAVAPELATLPEAVPLYAPEERMPDVSEAAPAEAVTSEPPPLETAEVPDAVAVEVSEVSATEVDPAEAVELPSETVVAEPAFPMPPLPHAKPKPPRVATPVDLKPVEPPPAEEVAAVAEPEVEPAEAAPETTAAIAEDSVASAATADGVSKDPAQSGTAGKAGTGARTASGTMESRSGGGNPGAVVDYAARLNAWLERHKEYPRRASLRRQEGEATLYFVIDRDGRVLEFRIEKSTGYKLLDEEVLNMIKRASPLPAPPESVPGITLEYRVPVGFAQH